MSNAYDFLPSATIDNIFITLSVVMNCIVDAGGGNNYKLPHTNRNKMKRDEHGNVLPIVARIPILDVEAESYSDTESEPDEPAVVFYESDDSSTASMAEEDNGMQLI